MISRMRFRALVRTTTPPVRGMVPPLRLVPAPRTVSGSLLSLHNFTTWPKASGISRPHYQSGQDRRQHRGVIGVGMAVGFGGEDGVRADDFFKILN